MKWFYSFLKKYWLRMVSGLILVTILAATALASPYISKLIVDDVIKKQNTGLLPKLIILLLAMVVIKGVCRFFSQVLFETSSQGVLYTMRDKVYRKLLLEDFAFYNKNRTKSFVPSTLVYISVCKSFILRIISYDWYVLVCSCIRFNL